MIEKLAQALQALGPDASFDELRDVLWLAQHLPPARPAEARPGPTPGPAPAPARPGDAHPSTTASNPPPRTDPSVAPRRRIPVAGTTHAFAADAGADLPIGSAARRVVLRGAEPLPHALSLARALRPLGRRREFGPRVVLDEIATAEGIAHTGLPLPVLRPRRERWFEIVLVVEQSPGLAAWRPQVRAFQKLLQRHGAFRRVEALALSIEGDAFTLRSAAGAKVSVASLQERHGRRLVILVSDCTSLAWHDGSFAAWLAPLGEKMPVAVAQPYAPEVWAHTALGFVELATLAVRPGTPTQALEVRRPSWAQGQAGLVLPVFAMEAASAGRWARMLMARGDAWSPAALLPCAMGASNDPVDAELRAALAASAPGTAGDDELGLLEAFRAAALPAARRLASGLAVVDPLTLPVMRLVQHTLAPEGGAAALAQVLASGLFVPSVPLRPDNEDTVTFQVAPSIRERLQAGLPRSHWQQVMLTIGRAIEEETGESVDILACIDDPLGQERLPPSARPFAEFARQSARRFQGARDAASESGGHQWLEEAVVGVGLTVRASLRVSTTARRLAYAADGSQLAVLHDVGIDLFRSGDTGAEILDVPEGALRPLRGRIRRTSRRNMVCWLSLGDHAVGALATACEDAAEAASGKPFRAAFEPVEVALSELRFPASSDAHLPGARHVLFLTQRYLPDTAAGREGLRRRLRRLRDELDWVLLPLDEASLSAMPDRSGADWVGALSRSLDGAATRRAIDALVPRLTAAHAGDTGRIGAMAWLRGIDDGMARLLHVERLADTRWIMQWPREHGGTLQVPVPADEVRGGDGGDSGMALIDDEGSVWLSGLAKRGEHFQLVPGTSVVQNLRCAPDGKLFATIDSAGELRVHDFAAGAPEER